MLVLIYKNNLDHLLIKISIYILLYNKVREGAMQKTAVNC